MRYQRIHSQIWSDEKFRTLSQEAKYLFIYILTSPHSNGIGLYVLPKQYIECDLEWSSKQLAIPFNELLENGLILYDEDSRLICIKNQIKHNPIENPKQAKSAEKIIHALPKSHLFSVISEQLNKPYHKPLVKLLNERYTIPIPQEEEKEEEKEKEKEEHELDKKVGEVIDYLNLKAGTNYSNKGKSASHIAARLKDGAKVSECFYVIDCKCSEWLDDPKMSKYLRPSTLFNSEKFECYVNKPACVVEDKPIYKEFDRKNEYA